ncbi:MAG: HAD family hydrolase [Chloroflexota bacterium]
MSRIIFDLDGTLYEDERVHQRYAEDLAATLPEGRSREFLRHWRRARAGEGVLAVGLGYDEGRDQLFRFREDRVTHRLLWSGEEIPSDEPGPLFGPYHFIGDWWQLLKDLAAHHGISLEQNNAAFRATREWMSKAGFPLRSEPGLDAKLAKLGQQHDLVAMSNSPRASVEDVLAQLGVERCFQEVVPDAAKPAGLVDYLARTGAADVVSIGDHYINDIEPALRAGARTIYIDRHGTRLGEESGNCRLVGSIPEAWEVLLED